MLTFIPSEFLDLLKSNQLNTFDKIWNHEIDWVEEPNQRRGGWSGVGRVQLIRDGETPLWVFVKKQQNHGRRTLRHPLRGEPTFRREFERLKFLDGNQFAAPKVVFYSESNGHKDNRAILVTVALNDYVPLDSLSGAWKQAASRIQQMNLIESVANGLRRFHDLGLVHRALYPKHIFVKNEGYQPEMAVIDLEKARFSRWFIYRAFFDLAALNRHAEGWRATQRLAFFKYYMKIKRLDFFSKFLCRLIVKRAGR